MVQEIDSNSCTTTGQKDVHSAEYSGKNGTARKAQCYTNGGTPIGDVKPHTEESSSTSSAPLAPPDGGYGWVVCMAAFMCNAILDGYMFSFGIFFVELLDAFGQSKAATSWAGSFLHGMSLMTGPLTGALVNTFGIRKVTIVGAIMACISCIVGSLSSNITTLVIFYGFFGGIGISFVFLPVILAVGFYFEKRRAFANGLAACGGGVGTFIMAHLSRHLIDVYAWRGALLILSGIVLNCAVFGALLRPLEKVAHPVECQSGNEMECNSTEKRDILKCEDPAQETLLSKTSTIPLHSTQIKSLSTGNIYKCTSPVWSSPEHHPNKGFIRPRTRTISHVVGTKTSPKFPLLARKDAFYSGSITNLKEFRSTQNIEAFRKSMINIPSNPEKTTLERFSMLKSCSDALRWLLGITLFKNPIFVIFLISCTLWTAQSNVMTYLPDYTITRGYSKQQATFLLSIVGVSNIIGRILIGWLCDLPHIDSVMVNTVALLTAGFLTLSLPFLANYGLLITIGIVFGFCMASWVSLRPIVLVDLLGIDSLTNALGLVAMFQGIGLTVGPPIAGFLYDWTKSYVATYVCTGVVFLASGSACITLRPIARWLKKRKNQESLSVDRKTIHETVVVI